jgi:hypothetical protein
VSLSGIKHLPSGQCPDIRGKWRCSGVNVKLNVKCNSLKKAGLHFAHQPQPRVGLPRILCRDFLGPFDDVQHFVGVDVLRHMQDGLVFARNGGYTDWPHPQKGAGFHQMRGVGSSAFLF